MRQSSTPPPAPGRPPAQSLLAGLGDAERMLLMMRDELYDGSWDRMEKDLENRRAGRPYVFRLVESVEADLAAIRRLRSLEADHDTDLGRLLNEEEPCTP